MRGKTNDTAAHVATASEGLAFFKGNVKSISNSMCTLSETQMNNVPQIERPPLGQPDLLCNGRLQISLLIYNFLSHRADVDFYMCFIAGLVCWKEVAAKPPATNPF